MKYASKEDLVGQIESEHARFIQLVESVPAGSRSEPGVWGDDWTVKDLLAHLMEWEQMFLGWHRAGTCGETPALPAPGYKWNETSRLNREIQRRHAKTSWKRVREKFDTSYDEIVDLTKSLSAEELLEPGAFPWTGKHPLTTYLGANTASHYRAAIKILKRWRKGRDSSQ